MADAAPQAPQVNDRHRTELAAALLIALLALYRRRTRQTLDALGLTTAPVVVSASTMAWLTAFANDRAAKAQRGINLRLGQAITELPDGADASVQRAALQQARTEMRDYNGTWLVPFLISTVSHQELVDTYRDQPSSTPGVSLADAVPWTWEQFTGYADECQAAAAASPASLDDLLAITGGMPAIHERCQCTCTPGREE